MVSIDAVSATVIIAFAGAFLSLAKIFSDQTESIKNTYFGDVQRVQANIKATKIIPRLIDFVRGGTGDSEDAVPVEDYVSDPNSLQEIDRIGSAVRQMYKTAEVYESCVNAAVSCWKGSLVLGLLILASFLVFPASDFLGAPILDELWIYVIALVFIFAFAAPMRNYVRGKEKLIKIIHETLLDKGP